MSAIQQALIVRRTAFVVTSAQFGSPGFTGFKLSGGFGSVIPTSFLGIAIGTVYDNQNTNTALFTLNSPNLGASYFVNLIINNVLWTSASATYGTDTVTESHWTWASKFGLADAVKYPVYIK